MGISVPSYNLHLNDASNSPGVLIGASPDWQIAQQKLAAANAFSGGLPTDANGNIDYNAAAKTLFQKGDFSDAGNLLTVGNQQRAIQMGLDSANQLQNGMGGGQPPAAQPTGTPTASAGGANPAVVKYIRDRAASYGVDPNIALAVAGTEGLRGFDPNGKPNLGDGGSSGGPFQLHYGGVASGGNAAPGLGDDFTKATGLDARDPSTWQQQIDFALAHAAKSGWGAWHGAAKAGIGEFAGIGGQGSGAPSPTADAAAPAPAAPVRVAQNGTSDAPSSTNPYAAAPPAAPGPSAPAAASPAPTQVAGPGAPTVPSGSPASPAPQVAPSVIDPTLGGLLKGQWVGNPGGYVSALRAQAVRLGTLGNTAAASAYDKQADAVERGIERNNIVTPTMKDYQIAVQQGFQGSQMDYVRAIEAQKLAAKGDPGVIRAAGQTAAAEADARNASDVAASGQKAEQQQEGEALGKLPGQLATAANNAKLQTNLVDQMLDAANQFRMGPGASTQQNINSKLVALGDMVGVDTASLKNQVGGYTDFNKLAGQLTRQSIKETGSSRAGIQEMQMVSGSLPSPDMNADGFRTVANQLKGLSDFTTAKQQAADTWLNKTGSMKGFEVQWNKSVTPAAFVLHRLSVDQPDMFQTTIQRMGQTPQGRAALQNVRSGLTWANSNGLLD